MIVKSNYYTNSTRFVRLIEYTMQLQSFIQFENFYYPIQITPFLPYLKNKTVDFRIPLSVIHRKTAALKAERRQLDASTE